MECGRNSDILSNKEHMVDYSKWNSFGDDEEEEQTFSSPRVTTFEGEKGRSFVIGPSGVNIVKAPTSAPVHIKTSKRELVADFQLDSTNGGVTESYTWSQTSHEAFIRKIVPSDLKASNVSVKFEPSSGYLSASDTKSNICLFEGNMSYKVEIDADDQIGSVQWELVTVSESSVRNGQKVDHRVLEITMKKVSPIPRSIIWWKNVFVGSSEIDVTAIAGRGSASKESASVWDEAHKLFREKIATRELINVDVGVDDQIATDR